MNHSITGNIKYQCPKLDNEKTRNQIKKSIEINKYKRKELKKKNFKTNHAFVHVEVIQYISSSLYQGDKK